MIIFMAICDAEGALSWYVLTSVKTLIGLSNDAIVCDIEENTKGHKNSCCYFRRRA
jgi:hypothetical protein